MNQVMLMAYLNQTVDQDTNVNHTKQRQHAPAANMSW